jgi:hypothetical protein
MFSSLFWERVYGCGINGNWFREELPHIFEQLISYLCIKCMTVISALNSTCTQILSLQTNRMTPSNAFFSSCMFSIFLFVPLCTDEEIRNIGLCTFHCFDVSKPVLSQTIGILDWALSECGHLFNVHRRLITAWQNVSSSCQATAVDLEWWHKSTPTKTLKRTFEPTRTEVTGGWRKLLIEELQNM